MPRKLIQGALAALLLMYAAPAMAQQGSANNPIQVDCVSGCSGGGGTVSQGPGNTNNPWYFDLQGSLPAGSNTIGGITQSGAWNTNASYGYTDSTTPLGAAGSFTGTVRWNTASQYTAFAVQACADQAGTLSLRATWNGTYFFTVSTAAVAAGGCQTIKVPITGNFNSSTQYEVYYLNGSTAQGNFAISSAFTSGN
jgi:hypothetical protein